MKRGLVLEGGGIRGVFTTGVLDAFMDNDIDFDYIVGVSIGATNAASFITKQRGRNHRILNNYVNDPRYMSLRNLIKTGTYFGWDFINNKLQTELDKFEYEKFHNSSTEMIVNITNCETGKSEFYDLRNNKEYENIYKATHALPLLSKPIKINGKLYLDGGISESIPVRKAIEDRCDKVIAIMTKDELYKPTQVSSRVLRFYLRKYPKVYEALKCRHLVYEKERKYIKKMKTKRKVYPIYPEVSTTFVSRIERDLDKINKLYKIGYDTGLKHVENIKQFLNEK